MLDLSDFAKMLSSPAKNVRKNMVSVFDNFDFDFFDLLGYFSRF